MASPVDDMKTALQANPDEAAADLFAAVVEQGIDFTSRDSCFKTLLALPSFSQSRPRSYARLGRVTPLCGRSTSECWLWNA
jgi:hypothetical protein